MDQELTRRALLASGAAIGMSTAGSIGAETRPAGEMAIEKIPLGKTGVKVTRLGMGASFPEYGERVLNYAYRSGIRYFDNAEGYLRGRTQKAVGQWVRDQGFRAEVFLVTKTYARTPEGAYESAVKSARDMQVDTIDLFMLHGLDDPELALDPTGEWKKLKDRLVRENKVRFIGFSTHALMSRRAACLANAAQGGWVDALMVACDPGLLKKSTALNKALDACSAAGVGLVAMKTTRGLGPVQDQPDAARDAFKELGMSPHAAMLAGMWSDGRFACVCSEMPSFKIIEENAGTARAFRRPLDDAQRKILHEGLEKLSWATCPGCDGSCSKAAGAKTDFCSIARFVAYHDHDGKRELAREMFAALPPEQRSWAGADLQAASQACHAHLDFASILRRAAQVLG